MSVCIYSRIMYDVKGRFVLHKLATEDWPVKKPPEANLHDMFVVSTRSRGIYVRFRPSPLPASPR